MYLSEYLVLCLHSRLKLPSLFIHSFFLSLSLSLGILAFSTIPFSLHVILSFALFLLFSSTPSLLLFPLNEPRAIAVLQVERCRRSSGEAARLILPPPTREWSLALLLDFPTVRDRLPHVAAGRHAQCDRHAFGCVPKDAIPMCVGLREKKRRNGNKEQVRFSRRRRKSED